MHLGKGGRVGEGCMSPLFLSRLWESWQQTAKMGSGEGSSYSKAKETMLPSSAYGSTCISNAGDTTLGSRT